MRNLLRRVAGGLSAALFLTGALSTVAFGLTNPPTFSPRLFTWQMTHYERHLIQINTTGTAFSVDQGQLGQSCNFAAGTCSVKVGALPYNAFLARGFIQAAVVCNAATTCTISLGTASAGAQIVNGQDVKGAGTAGVAMTIVAANIGIAATGNGIAQTGADGGFDLWATITFTGAAPSTGTIVFILEYYAPNDGNCIAVPIGGGTTSPAC